MKHIWLIFGLFGLSACATIDRGVMDYARIDTVPQGAKVTLIREGDTENTKPRVCDATPCAISVPRRSTLVAQIEKDGYQMAEVFMFPSSMRGGAAGSAIANSTIFAGSGASIGAWSAATYNVFTFGLDPFSQSAFASSGAAIGLGFGMGMIAIDGAAGSNLNLFPNPVVIELAPTGQETISDPITQLFKDRFESRKRVTEICGTSRPVKSKLSKKEGCAKASERRDEADRAFSAAMKKRKAAEKAALKARRDAQRQAEKTAPSN